jgi:hypothetical protein
MRIDCALLCDAATVREGLLHILGGGITRANRPEFPAPLMMVLAMRIMVHPTEAATEHQCRVLLLNADGEQGAEIGIGFAVADPTALTAGEEASLPIPINLANVTLQAEGLYSFEILIDGIHQASVPFRAVLIEGAEGEEINPEQQGEEN